MIKNNLFNSNSFIYLLSIFACAISFVEYGPIVSHFFESDQAIHVLMVLDFDLPEDSYYWGQNRLGSFMPLIAWPVYKIFGIHPIWILGVLTFVLLWIGYIILQKYVKSLTGKILLLFWFLFPHPTYIFILLLGHPYAGQTFCMIISIVFFVDFYNKLKFEERYAKEIWKLFASLFFMFLAIWINEFSLILIIAFLLVILKKSIRLESYRRISVSKKYFSVYLIFLTATLLGLLMLSYLKTFACKDLSYNNYFFFNIDAIARQFGYFWNQILNIVLVRNHHSIFQCIFYYFVSLTAILILFKQKKIDFIFILILLSSIILFFSNWNLRSHFDAKYYSIVYLAVGFWIAYHLSVFPLLYQYVFGLLIFVSLAFSNLDFILITRGTANIFEKYSEAKLVPDGVVFGNYWDVYRLSGVTQGRLYGVSSNEGDFRNRHKMDKILTFRNWYLYQKNLPTVNGNQLDTLSLCNNIHLFYVGKKYKIRNDTLVQYIRQF